MLPGPFFISPRVSPLLYVFLKASRLCLQVPQIWVWRQSPRPPAPTVTVREAAVVELRLSSALRRSRRWGSWSQDTGSLLPSCCAQQTSWKTWSCSRTESKPNLLLACPSLSPSSITSGPDFAQRHKCPWVIGLLQCTVGNVGTVPLLIPTCLCMYGQARTYHRLKKCFFMHLVHFDLSALSSVAIHPIQFILPLQPPFVSGSDDLCGRMICIGAQGRTRTLN